MSVCCEWNLSFVPIGTLRVWSSESHAWVHFNHFSYKAISGEMLLERFILRNMFSKNKILYSPAFGWWAVETHCRSYPFWLISNFSPSKLPLGANQRCNELEESQSRRKMALPFRSQHVLSPLPSLIRTSSSLTLTKKNRCLISLPHLAIYDSSGLQSIASRPYQHFPVPGYPS